MSRLVRSAARPDIGWRMVLIDSDIPDAWVLPDGKVAVYKGILTRLHDDQEVAALLTHQMAHSLLGHNMFLLGRSEIQEVLLAQDADYGGPMHEQLAYNLGISIAEGVQVMPYSRMMESEADDLSMVMMLKAGYDPAAAIGTWQWLSDESRFAMEYLSSHPSVSWRIEQMTDQLSCYHKAFEETWGHKPAGLEEQYRDSTIECPPFVTGLMGNIKQDHRAQNDQQYMYDWDDEPGYEAAYYDHVRYNRYFYDDPYYNAWHRGRVSYSFGFHFGGFSYYRWSPLWSGWNYYNYWRPSYIFRNGRGYNHYNDHPMRYNNAWRYRSMNFRDRHYDRDHYVDDERRYRDRRREDDGQDQKYRRREVPATTSGGTAAVRDLKRDRMLNTGQTRPQVQPRRVKRFEANSNTVDSKVTPQKRTTAPKSRVRPTVRDRKGVMDFRNEPQKQPARTSRTTSSKNRTYTTPKREGVAKTPPRTERANTSYKSRRGNDAAKRETSRKAPPSGQKATSKPKTVRQPATKPKPQSQPRVQSQQSRPKAQSQPRRQTYKAPSKPSAPKASSSSKSSSSNKSSSKSSSSSKPSGNRSSRTRSKPRQNNN